MPRPRPQLAPVRPDGVIDLVDASRRGDARAREALARWCLPRIRRTIWLAVGPTPDADDLTQTVIARVFAHLEGYRAEARFHVWVDRIAVNAVRDHYRARARARLLPYDDGRPQDEPAPRPDDQAERQRLLERLAGHLATLPPQQRLPLVLRHVHGYTVPEIAAMLEISFEAARKRLHRGRRDLRQRLDTDPYWRAVLGGLDR